MLSLIYPHPEQVFDRRYNLLRLANYRIDEIKAIQQHNYYERVLYPRRCKSLYSSR